MESLTQPRMAPEPSRPLVIAGPCMAESFELLDETARFLKALSSRLGFDFIFKASFDKANRTSISSPRGPGLRKGCAWLADIKERHGLQLLTDIHESYQVAPAAEVCDALQIPAFLCRQTDLLVAAVKSKRMVNVKKGQFMAPAAAKYIVSKVREVCREDDIPFNASLTERGSSFGYGDLVVDMRALAVMANFAAPVLFDITHSTQRPPAGDGNGVSGASRQVAPLLARAATATGYLAGYYLEVHSSPNHALSDAQAQLNYQQAELLLGQLVPLWQHSKDLRTIDREFA